MPFAGDSLLRCSRLVSVQEESVDRRSGTGDVCSERAELHERTRQRRRCEVVRRERCEVARTLDAFQRSEERRSALLVALLTSARVECGVYLLGRALDHLARQDEQDPVILGKLESFEFATVARAELRSVLQEVRNVRAQRTRKRAQLLCGIGIASQRVCQPQ